MVGKTSTFQIMHVKKYRPWLKKYRGHKLCFSFPSIKIDFLQKLIIIAISFFYKS